MEIEKKRLSGEVEKPVLTKEARVILAGLKSVYESHVQLGDHGRQRVMVNQFKDEALRADLKAEEEMVRATREWAEEGGVKVKMRGEEVGELEVGKGKKEYFMCLDGLDGSGNYLKENKKWGYGTMVALAESNNPDYEDFEVAGIVMLNEGKVWLAEKGRGIYVFDIEREKWDKMRKFEVRGYEDNKILADNYFKEAREYLSEKQKVWKRTGSMVASIVSILKGERLGLADVTRKGNLEQPVAYRLLKEMGGVVVDKEGEDIGGKEFDSWGQEERVPVFIASSEEIVDRMREEVGF